jgi:hypothetical protein
MFTHHTGAVHLRSRGSINGHILVRTTKRCGSVITSYIYVCSGQGQVADACECGNEPLSSIKCWEFLD